MGATVDFELGEKLSKARRTLAEVQAAEGQYDVEIRDLRQALGEAESKAADDKETSLLDGHRPNPKLDESVELIRLKLHAAGAKLQTARGAAARQRDIVQALEGEIQARRRGVVLAQAKPLAAQFAGELDRLAILARQIGELVGAENLQAHELFSTDPRVYSAENATAQIRLQAIYSVLAIERGLSLYDGDIRAKMGWAA